MLHEAQNHSLLAVAYLLERRQQEVTFQNMQEAKSEGDVGRECTASLALSMLLLLKQHLKAAYSMSPERIATFNPGQGLCPIHHHPPASVRTKNRAFLCPDCRMHSTSTLP